MINKEERRSKLRIKIKSVSGKSYKDKIPEKYKYSRSTIEVNTIDELIELGNTLKHDFIIRYSEFKKKYEFWIYDDWFE